MDKRYIKGLLSILLVVAMIFGQFGQLGFAEKSSDIEEMLANLTDEQLSNIPKLDKGEDNKIRLSENINLEDDSLIKVIVQLREEPIKIQNLRVNQGGLGRSTVEGEKKVIFSQQTFKSDLNEKNLYNAVKITNTYKQVFNGMSMTIPANRLNELSEIPEVKTIWEDKTVQLVEPISPDDIKIGPRMVDSSRHLEISKLHEEGIKGRGVKVGVLDTGIDYNHPDLKDAYAGGYNYVDLEFEYRDDSDPMEATYEEWVKLNNENPSDFPEYIGSNAYYTSHGTHVSGTIASKGVNNEEYPIKGLAPEVELYSYRVLGPYGSGDFGWITKGIDDAAKHGMDVINLSLGAKLNDPEHPASISIDNATKAGIICIVASGNDGPDLYTLGIPGTSPLGITVGASDSSINVPTFDSKYKDYDFNMKLFSREFSDKLEDLEGKEYEVVNIGLGTIDELTGKDLEGKTALVQRGEIPFYDKIINAKNAGVSNVIIWNNEAGDIEHYFGENNDLLLTFAINQEDGLELLKRIDEKEKLLIKNLGAPVVKDGDRMADFSSRGPIAKTHGIKPDIVAPGVDVLSTVPSFINSKEDNSNYNYAYSRMSGTSMATPHITGIVALMKQYNKNLSPYDVKAALMNNARNLNGDYSLFDMGAGKVDPYKSVKSTFNIKVNDTWKEDDYETASISFGSHFTGGNNVLVEKELVFENKSSESKILNSRVDFLSSEIRELEDASLNNIQIIVDDSLSINGNESKTVKVSILVPDGADEGTYQGYIFFESEANEEYRLPFSIRISDKGIESYEIINKAYFADKFHPFIGPRWGLASLIVKSQMEKAHLILRDGHTEEVIGYLGWSNVSKLQIGKEQILSAFAGNYFELTGNEEDPIGTRRIPAPEGYYKIEVVVLDSDNNTYTAMDDLFYDKTAPVIIMDLEPGIYELSEEDATKWFNGNVYDSNVELMASVGYDVDQSKNTIIYYQNSSDYSGKLPVENNGDFKFGVDYSEVEYGDVINLSLFPFDYATSGDMSRMVEYFFIKKGQAYSTIKTDKEMVRPKEDIKVTLGTKYIEELKSIEYRLGLINGIGNRFKEVKINEDFQKYADENKLVLSLEVDKSSPVTIRLDIKGNPEKEFNESMDLIDLIYEAPDSSGSTPRLQIERTLVTNHNDETEMIANGFVQVELDGDNLSIRDIYPSEDVDLKEGEEIYISFKAPRGGKANFKILLPEEFASDFRENNMTEVSEGFYSGKWKAPKGLSLKALEIDLEYEDLNGNKLNEKAAGKINVIQESTLPEKPEEPKEPELPLDPGKPIDQSKPAIPEKPKEKPEEPKEEPEIETPKEAEIVELTDQEIEDLLEDSFKDRKDIPSWAERAIGTLTDEKILSGRADGKFDPSANISRAEFLKLVVEALNLEKSSEKVKAFKDVKSSDWFKDYVDIGYSNGLASGISKDQFGPNLNISREDLSVMVYNAVKDLKLEADGKTNKDFKDEKEISGYAKEAVGELSKLGIISGKGENKFAPKENATRAEAAVIIYRLLELMSK